MNYELIHNSLFTHILGDIIIDVHYVHSVPPHILSYIISEVQAVPSGLPHSL